jgi:hypothetical protein
MTFKVFCGELRVDFLAFMSWSSSVFQHYFWVLTLLLARLANFRCGRRVKFNMQKRPGWCFPPRQLAKSAFLHPAPSIPVGDFSRQRS